MMQEEDFELAQYPDFMDSLPGFEEDIFETDIHEDDDGYIEFPFLPLRDLVLYPQMVTPLFVGRERSLEAIRAAVANNENIIVSAQKDGELMEPGVNDIFSVGTEVTIGKALRMPDDSTSVLAQGKRRVESVGP